jgi:radical SAM protein (TIGR04043 family)
MFVLSGSDEQLSYKEFIRLKVELQSFGLKIADPLCPQTGGAGPAEGHAFQLGPIISTIPIKSPFVQESPFTAQMDGAGYNLLRDGRRLIKLHVVPRPKFYEIKDEDGTPFSSLALLHGRDCLGSTVDQRCVFWNTPARCKFCGIELSYQSGATTIWKSPESLARVAVAARDLDGVKHVTLTSGTSDSPDMGTAHLAECARAIKESSGLAVHAQIFPSYNPEVLELLYDNGVDTVGIHIESWDRNVLRRIAPAKANLSFPEYEKLLSKAVSLFGTGQVSSFLIVGLGEKPASVIEGARILSSMGVFPYIVPLRPIPGSQMADQKPPPPDIMWDIYTQASEIIKQNGLIAARSKAGCVRCSGCSAIGDFV